MKFHSHLNTAIALLRDYDGKTPFSAYIKNHFRENKKFGSSDRKNIGRCCYSYFRLGNALNDLPMEEKIFCGLFLTTSISDPMLQFFKPEWNSNLTIKNPDLRTKIDFLKTLYPSLDMLSIFKWSKYLSNTIEEQPFVLSHLQQPDLFVRVRPGQYERVIGKLNKINKQKNIGSGLLDPFSQFLRNQTISFPPGFDIEKHFLIDKEVVIQDLSSQRIAEFLTVIEKPVHQVWDSCAGSGGKSILAVDHLHGIQLTVSDIRESILINLQKRFHASGITKFTLFTIDLTKPSIQLPSDQSFDLVICDVPCTGSGTWGRTPEQLIHFNEKKIAQYAAMQKTILLNVIPFIKPGGWLLYSTCSVFEEENECVIHHLLQNQPLQIIKQELLKGYDIKADTLFAVLLQKK